MDKLTPLEVVWKRDRLIVLAGLVGIAGLAWVYVGYLAWDMGHMAMSMEMAMPRMQKCSITVPDDGEHESLPRWHAPAGGGHLSVDTSEVCLSHALSLAVEFSHDRVA